LAQRSDCELCIYPSDRCMRWTRRLRRGLELVVSLPSRRAGRTATGPGNTLPVGTGARRGWLRRTYRSWTARSQRKAFFSDQFDLYHEPNFIPVPTSLPIVATVHDLSVLLHPEWHPAERVRWYEEQFSRSLEQVNHIITVSEFTREQVLRVLGFA